METGERSFVGKSRPIWNSPRIRITFLVTFLIGIVAHGMALFNKYSYHDDVFTLFNNVGGTVNLGRWMLEVFRLFEIHVLGDGPASLPIINGGIAILCIAVTACIVVELADIKSKYICAFIGALMVSFPTVTGIFAYMFTLHYYMISMLLGAFGVFLICRASKWYHSFLGAVCIAVSLGIYQAFLPFTVSLALLYFMKYVIDSKEISGGCVFKNILRVVAWIIAGFVLYLGIQQLFLWGYHIELSSYQGIDSAGETTISEYLQRIGVAYKIFLFPTLSRDQNYYMYPHAARAVYYVTILGILILGTRRIVIIFRDSKIRATFMMIFLLALPLCTNLIFVMADRVHALMVYAQLMPFLVFAYLCDDESLNGTFWNKIGFRAVGLVLAGLVFLYCRYDNRCYLKAEFSQQEAISYYTVLAARIKSIDGYTDTLPVAYINQFAKTDETLTWIGELKDVKTLPYDNVNGMYMSTYSWKQFMAIWCGFNPVTVDEAIFADNPEIEEMPSYPDSGSIAIIDGVIVVKF